MGWIGDMSRVMDALKADDADRDEEGRFLIRGGRVVTFMGAGKEAVVDAAAEYRVNGEWRLLVPRLPGGTIITVI